MIRFLLFVLLVSVNSAFGQRYAGIEIGAKGVKWIVIELDLNNTKNPVTILDSGDKNTTLSALNGSSYAQASLENTIQAIQLFYEDIHENHEVPGHNIFVVASSGLPKANNMNLLVDGVKKVTGKSLDTLSVEDEVRLCVFGLCLQHKDRLGDALVIDIGSGNTKGGYLAPASPEKDETITIFHLPGTVTLTTAVQEIAKQRKIDFYAANDEAKAKMLMPSIHHQVDQNDELKSRRLVYLNGGIVWAVATFLHPEMNGHANVPLTSEDLQRMRQSLRRSNGEYPEIDSAKLDASATKQINIVKKVFTPENLVVGNEILCTLSETLEFENREVFFVRNGRIAWLLGFVSEKGKQTAKKSLVQR